MAQTSNRKNVRRGRRQTASASTLQGAIKAGGDTVGSEVDIPIDAFDAMNEKWVLIDDLMCGTQRMRDQGKTYLPMEVGEKVTPYEARLARTVLFNGLRDTVKRLTTRPFSKPVTLTQAEALPDFLVGIQEDVDGTGKNLTQLARELFEDAVKYGKFHLLVDYPVTGGTMNLSEERAAQIQPRLIRIEPTQVIGWHSQKLPSGKTIITQVRMKETQVEPVGEYGTEPIEYVRVLGVNTWELHKKSPDDENFARVDEGTHTFGGVPLITGYVTRSGFMTSDPPLEDLAYINVAHWQSMSDQRNILRFARVAILFGKGLTDEDLEQGIVLAANQMVTSGNADADLKYVEHSGKAIASGEEDLRRLEERMEVLGLQPFIQRASGRQTATAKSIDESKQQSEIQAWVRELEAVLYQGYAAAAKWVKQELPAEFAIDIWSDFGIGERDAKEIEALIKIRTTGELSRETFLAEIRRRGLVSDTVNVEEEIARIDAHGGTLSDMVPTVLPIPIPEEENELEGIEE